MDKKQGLFLFGINKGLMTFLHLCICISPRTDGFQWDGSWAYALSLDHWGLIPMHSTSSYLKMIHMICMPRCFFLWPWEHLHPPRIYDPLGSGWAHNFQHPGLIISQDSGCIQKHSPPPPWSYETPPHHIHLTTFPWEQQQSLILWSIVLLLHAC